MSISSGKIIDPTVFKSLNCLNNINQHERVNGSIKLLQHIHTKTNTEEYEYTLKRLIRGLGSATCFGRSGFFTTLVSYLTIADSTIISTLFELMNKELRVGKHIGSKEDSDAYIGRALLSGALIRCGQIYSTNDATLIECVKILLQVSKHKAFHASLAYIFLANLVENLTEQKFITVMWPIMKTELTRSWGEHKINTVYFLLATQQKYPYIIDCDFLENSIKTKTILTTLAYKHFGQLFWSKRSITIRNHPAYKILSNFFGTYNEEEVLKFWSSEINELLAAPHKFQEIVTLQIVTDILMSNQRIPSPKLVKTLVSKRFVRMMVFSLKDNKQEHYGFIVNLYNEFFIALNIYFDKIEDESKIQIIKRLLLDPGTIMLEKYTLHKIIHQLASKLSHNELIKLFSIYKGVLLGSLTKTKTDPTCVWLNIEKQNAVYMIQYLLTLKSANINLNWRAKQIQFLACVSLFHTNAIGEPSKKERANITKELAANLKNVFFTALHSKLLNLKQEKRMLLNIKSYIDKVLSKKSLLKCLRVPISEKTINAWNEMHARLQQKSKLEKSKTIDLVFHIMFLHMGFQLFREPAMAQTAIFDLEKCMENAQIKTKFNKIKFINGESDEPEWIEVIVDLFLHLLSQNVCFLRTIVNVVFPHLCQYLNLTSMYQIFSVLDMKDGRNPLCENSKEMDGNNLEVETNYDENTNDQSSSESDDNQDVEDDEGTVPDQLRNAISTALDLTRADVDTESIDLNDIDDAEVERLDRVLSSAFKIGNKFNGRKEKKCDRITGTTLMHFRIRVLDLLEIYLKTSPNLSICLEILENLFRMREHCYDKNLQPLTIKINRVLVKLLTIRSNFSDVSNVSEEQFCDLFKNLAERKVNVDKIDQHNRLVGKCFAFFVNCSQLIQEVNGNKISVTKEHALLALITDYVKEFIQSRNPVINYVILRNIFNIRWSGIWVLGKILGKKGLKPGVRSYRRSQLIELLTRIYKNHGYVNQDVQNFTKMTISLEKYIAEFVTQQCSNEVDSTISAKEFSALISLIIQMKKFQKTLVNTQALEWSKIDQKIQQLRQFYCLTSKKTYIALYHLLDLKIEQSNNNGNNQLSKSRYIVSSTEKVIKNIENEDRVKILKRKKDPLQNKKLKKLRKEEKLCQASEDLNNSIYFGTNFVDVM